MNEYAASFFFVLANSILHEVFKIIRIYDIPCVVISDN